MNRPFLRLKAGRKEVLLNLYLIEAVYLDKKEVFFRFVSGWGVAAHFEDEKRAKAFFVLGITPLPEVEVVALEERT